jgi:phage FluMu protein Com
MKIVAFIGAGILIFFGTIMVWGSFDPFNGQAIWLPVGLVIMGVGLVIIFFAARRKQVAPTTNVTLNVDLPGNVAMDAIKCKSCGGVLAAENITMVQGAPMVTCPYCHTVYQMTEEPKW